MQIEDDDEDDVQTKLSIFGIERHSSNKKKNNRRGKRGGRRKQRHIAVFATRHASFDRFPTYSGPPSKPNFDNIIRIDTRNVFVVSSERLLIGQQNCRSCNNKMLEIRDVTEEENIDIMFLTKTWLRTQDEKLGHTNRLKPPGYCVRSFPRKFRSGGGIAVIIRNVYMKYIVKIHELNFKSFEAIQLCLNMSNTNISIVCVYRPTKSKKNKCTDSEYFDELGVLIDTQCVEHKNVILVGDLNIHYDDVSESLTRKTKALLSDHDLHQLVKEPTHEKGHTLDLIIGPINDSIIRSHTVHDKHISDHKLIVC